MKKMLVTGGAGFIGSHLAHALLAHGDDIRVIDNLCTGNMANLEDILEQIQFVKASINDTDILNELMQGVDTVFHEAALPSVPRSLADPMGSHEACSTGTLNVLISARDAGVRRVVYAASSSAYGDTPSLPKVEDMPANPLSPYAVMKYTGEQYCRVFKDQFDLSTVALRYFNIFGPRQDPNSQYSAVIPKFIMALLKGEAPTIFGDGEHSRDFTYIENVVSANLLAGECPEPSQYVYNVACGERYTLNHLFRESARLIGSDIEPIYADPRPGDVKDSLASIERAQKDFGYKIRVGFSEGLQKTLDSLQGLKQS